MGRSGFTRSRRKPSSGGGSGPTRKRRAKWRTALSSPPSTRGARRPTSSPATTPRFVICRTVARWRGWGLGEGVGRAGTECGQYYRDVIGRARYRQNRTVEPHDEPTVAHTLDATNCCSSSSSSLQPDRRAREKARKERKRQEEAFAFQPRVNAVRSDFGSAALYLEQVCACAAVCVCVCVCCLHRCVLLLVVAAFALATGLYPIFSTFVTNPPPFFSGSTPMRRIRLSACHGCGR